jgi:hypothetical protein
MDRRLPSVNSPRSGDSVFTQSARSSTPLNPFSPPVCQSLLQDRRLTLTGLGRSMPVQAYTKHAIKRVDRFLENRHLRSERPLYYWVMLRALLGSLKHPLILVDWSRIDSAGCAFLLRAAIPLTGRSFAIFKSIHEQEGCHKVRRVLSLWRPGTEHWRSCRGFGGEKAWKCWKKPCAMRCATRRRA